MCCVVSEDGSDDAGEVGNTVPNLAVEPDATDSPCISNGIIHDPCSGTGSAQTFLSSLCIVFSILLLDLVYRLKVLIAVQVELVLHLRFLYTQCRNWVEYALK